MTAEQLTSFLAILSPRVLALLIEQKGLSELGAIRIFYNSKFYETLEREETKLWHLSAETLYSLLAEELETGKITYPEEL